MQKKIQTEKLQHLDLSVAQAAEQLGVTMEKIVIQLKICYQKNLISHEK